VKVSLENLKIKTRIENIREVKGKYNYYYEKTIHTVEFKFIYKEEEITIHKEFNQELVALRLAFYQKKYTYAYLNQNIIHLDLKFLEDKHYH